MVALLVIIAIGSLLCGSFIGMLSYRLPIMLEREWTQQHTERFNLLLPASHCTSCKQPIAWYTNIPLLGYFISGRQCRHCNTAISPRYLWIEWTTLIAALVAASFLIATESGSLLQLSSTVDHCYLLLLIVISLIITLAVIDIEQGLLPDLLTYLLLWSGIIASNLGISSTAINDSIWGVILGYMLLWSVYQLMKLISGKEGMGYGDFKYLAAIGAWAGWLALPIILLIASLSAILYALFRKVVMRTNLDTAIRFGPFLSLGFYCYLVWGNWIAQAIFNL